MIATAIASHVVRFMVYSSVKLVMYIVTQKNKVFNSAKALIKSPKYYLL